MGGGGSKPPPPKEVENHEVEETSSGLHIVEIHVQSVGMGFLSLLLIGGALFAVYKLYRKCMAKRARLAMDAGVGAMAGAFNGLTRQQANISLHAIEMARMGPNGAEQQQNQLPPAV